MVEFRPLDPANLRFDRRRWLVGLCIDSRRGRLLAVLVANETRGLDTRVEIVGAVATRMPPRLRSDVQSSARSATGTWRHAALTAAYLAECSARLVGRLAERQLAVWDRVTTIGVIGPGVRARGPDGLTAWSSLSDAARIAELTGLNVIDDFVARDVANEGTGQALLAAPWWMLLRDADRSRIVVELSRPMRWVRLPAARTLPAHAMACLTQLSAGLIAAPSPMGSTRLSAAQGTACVVEALVAARSQLVADDWLLIGGGQCAAITAALRDKLPDQTIETEASLGLPRDSLQPAAAAMLAALFLDQIPASATMLSGARAPRLLGRIVPGSAQRWQRMLLEMSQQRPASVSLRGAV